MSKLFRTQVWFCRTAVRLKLLHFRCCRRCIAKIQPNSGHKLQRDTVWNWSSLMHLAKSQRLRIYSCWLHTHVCLLNDAVPKCQSPKSHSITMFFTHSLFWDKPWEILDSFKYPISAVPSLSFRVISSFPWAFWLPLLAEQKMDMFKKSGFKGVQTAPGKHHQCYSRKNWILVHSHPWNPSCWYANMSEQSPNDARNIPWSSMDGMGLMAFVLQYFGILWGKQQTTSHVNEKDCTALTASLRHMVLPFFSIRFTFQKDQSATNIY